MIAQWTADVIGEMHLRKITKKQLAEAMGVTPEYVSMVLNGHRSPAGIEQKCRTALASILESLAGQT